MPTNSKDIHPVNPTKRFEIIDIIRGFALFGVLLANIRWTSQDFALTNAQLEAISLTEINVWLDGFILTFIEFKFYTLFSILFGLGFAMQLNKSEEKQLNIVPIFRRRMFILFVIGIVHATLVWFGDILHIYAALGFVLMLFRNASNATLIKWILGIGILTGLLPFIDWLIQSYVDPVANTVDYEAIKSMRFESLSSTNWIDVMRLNTEWNMAEYTNLRIGGDGIFYWYLNVFWKFLLGFYMGRNLMLQRAQEQLGKFKKLFVYGGVLGLIGCLAWSISSFVFDRWLPSNESPLSISALLLEFGVLALSMSYLSALVLLYFKTGFSKQLAYLAPLGRMALTNYLMQSVCIIVVFYGVGLNQLGKIGTFYCLVATILIFGLQIAISKWWLSKFKFGPMEWLWRSLTYGKWQRFRIR
ncbi:DUF418 domain-containing protein [Flagellimonas sp. 2504JD4-2]